MAYEFLKNADGEIMRASGATPEELFGEALYGMMAYMEPRIFHNNDAEADRIMKLAAADRATLLIDFLRAAHGLATKNNELYEGARFAKLTETELEVELYGRLVKQFDREIKAVTCHGVAVRQNATGIWEVEIDLQ